MKMKMKVLAGTISLLCFSQVSQADITSTITLNGLTHSFTFVDIPGGATAAEQAQQASTSPTNEQAAFFVRVVNGVPIIPDQNGIGAIIRSTDTTKPNDPPVVMIKTAKTEVVVQKTLANGVVDSSVISTGTTTAFNSVVQAYLTDPVAAVAANPTLITAATASPAAFDKVQDATAKASADLLASSASRPEDATAQTQQVAALQAVTSGLDKTLATTPFVSTVAILGNKAVTYVFADAAAAQAAANNPSQYATDFPGVTSLTGLVTQNTSNGKTVTLVRTDANTVVVAEPQTDGTTKYTKVTGTVANLAGKVNTFLTTGTGGTTIPATNTELLATVTTNLQIAVNTPGVPASALAGLNNTLIDVPALSTQAERDLATQILNAHAANGAANLAKAQANLQSILANPNATQAQRDAANAKIAEINNQAAIIAKYAGKNVNTLTSAQIAELSTANNALYGANGAKGLLAQLNDILLALMDPVLQQNAAAARATVAAEKAKVLSALGTEATAQVVTAAAALDATLAVVEATGQKSAADTNAINVAGQNFANQLAGVKTNQFQAANSRSSHIAGNPMSTMNMTVDSMFNQAAEEGTKTTNIASSSSDTGMTTSVGVGVQYGYYDLGGRSANTVTLPLSVTAKFNPKHQLTLSVPLSYIAVQNQSDAYQVGVGLAYKYNVTDNWSLTPAMSYAYRSMDNMQNEYLDTRTSTSTVGGSVSSRYTWNFSQMNVSLTNMLGYFQNLDSNDYASKSLNLGTIGTYNGTALNSTLSNYIVKNGLHASKMFGNFKVGAYFTDTHYFGSKLYFNQFNEFGLSLKPQNAGKMLDALTVDANYLFSIAGPHSNELDGFRLNLGYKF
jgi:hypothetical protein